LKCAAPVRFAHTKLHRFAHTELHRFVHRTVPVRTRRSGGAVWPRGGRSLGPTPAARQDNAVYDSAALALQEALQQALQDKAVCDSAAPALQEALQDNAVCDSAVPVL